MCTHVDTCIDTYIHYKPTYIYECVLCVYIQWTNMHKQKFYLSKKKSYLATNWTTFTSLHPLINATQVKMMWAFGHYLGVLCSIFCTSNVSFKAVRIYTTKDVLHKSTFSKIRYQLQHISQIHKMQLRINRLDYTSSVLTKIALLINAQSTGLCRPPSSPV